MIYAFIKENNTYKAIFFKEFNSFLEFFYSNNVLIILSESKNVLDLRADINIIIVSNKGSLNTTESNSKFNLEFIKDCILRSLEFRGSEPLQLNKICKIIDKIHSLRINGSRILLYSPANSADSIIKSSIDTARDNIFKAIESGFFIKRKIALEIAGLKFNLNND